MKLPVSHQNATYGLHPFFKNNSAMQSQTENPQVTLPEPAVSLSDRVAMAEATVLGFTAEHSLPFTIVPELICLSKQFTKDKAAMDSLSVDRTSASYKTKYGLAKSFTEELVEELKFIPFSLNIDEATSKTNHRVVSVMVSYFCQKQQEVVVKHLASFPIIRVDSKSLYNELVELFEKFKIP